jgi:hypothetical protein
MPNDLSTFIIWIMILVSKLLSQSLSFSFGSWSNLLQLILSLQIEYIKSRELWEDSILWTIQLVMLGSLFFYAKAYWTESTLKQSDVLMVSGQVTFQRRSIYKWLGALYALADN